MKLIDAEKLIEFIDNHTNWSLQISHDLKGKINELANPYVSDLEIHRRIENAKNCVSDDNEIRNRAIEERIKEIYKINEVMEKDLSMSDNGKRINRKMFDAELRNLRELLVPIVDKNNPF